MELLEFSNLQKTLQNISEIILRNDVTLVTLKSCIQRLFKYRIWQAQCLSCTTLTLYSSNTLPNLLLILFLCPYFKNRISQRQHQNLDSVLDNSGI